MCITCGVDISHRHRNSKYCSQRCKDLANGMDPDRYRIMQHSGRQCKICKAGIGHLREGAKFCSKKCSNRHHNLKNSLKNIEPDMTGWKRCPRCKERKQKINFKMKGKKLDTHCIPCRKEKNKEIYQYKTRDIVFKEVLPGIFVRSMYKSNVHNYQVTGKNGSVILDPEKPIYLRGREQIVDKVKTMLLSRGGRTFTVIKNERIIVVDKSGNIVMKSKRYDSKNGIIQAVRKLENAGMEIYTWKDVMSDT